MKKLACIIQILIFLTLTGQVSATDWNTINPQYFTAQKDVADNLDTYSHACGSVFYGGIGYVFINHDRSNVAEDNYIVLRKLTYSSADGAIPYWNNNSDETTPENLKNLGPGAWQPAPVVFKGTLLLFVKQSNKIRYSKYNQGLDTWSVLQDGPLDCYPSIMAAAVVDDYLCLATIDASRTHLVIKYTNDMVNWGEYATLFKVGRKSNPVLTDFFPVSAISRTYFSFDGKLSTKLIVGYIDESSHALTAEFSFGSLSGNIPATMVLSGQSVVANDNEYSSIALAEGTVKGPYTDPRSGIVTQAFLKRAAKDDWRHAAYRILRYSKTETGAGVIAESFWSLSESNLVTISSPVHMWADDYMNLTAINVPVIQSNKDIRQYMCLIYRGYDDWNHPLNSAWAETDYYKYSESTMASAADNNLFKTYIGYIEGPAPYFVNKPSLNYPLDPYVNESNKKLSLVTFSHSEGSSNEDVINYSAGIKINASIKGFKIELSEKLGNAFSNVTESVNKTSLSVYPTSESKGRYIYLKPALYRANYTVTDVHGVSLYKTFYFYNKGIMMSTEVHDLEGGLEPGKPETYYNRGVNFADYEQFGSSSVSWARGSSTESTISINSLNSRTFSTKTDLQIGEGIAEIFQLVESGTFEYETTSTISTGNALMVTTELNKADTTPGSTDLDSLAYNFYWLRPSVTASKNWWVPNGLLQAQSPWCLTYEVTQYHYVDGRREAVRNLKINETVTSTESKNDKSSNNNEALSRNPVSNPEKSSISLSQNFPNPFSSTTTIRYHLNNESKNNNDPEGYSHVTLAIHDINGTLVASLADENQAPGDYQVVWNSSGLGSGFYFCSIVANGSRKVIKLLKMK